MTAQRTIEAGGAMRPFGIAAKRAFDLVATLVGGVFVLPVAGLLAACIRLGERGPVLFKQQRVGFHGELFTVLKFRTMQLHDEHDNTITTATDKRVTPLGAFMRRYKLDELPQLWNVITGHMSLVGPRPDVPGYYDKLEGDEKQVLELRPGVTGPASLFFRNEEELLSRAVNPKRYNDEVIFPKKTELNLRYLENWSFLRDIAYILITVCPPLDRVFHLIPKDTIMSPEEFENENGHGAPQCTEGVTGGSSVDSKEFHNSHHTKKA